MTFFSSLGQKFLPPAITQTINLAQQNLTLPDPPPSSHEVDFEFQYCFAVFNSVRNITNFITYECVQYYLDKCIDNAKASIASFNATHTGVLILVDELQCTLDDIEHPNEALTKVNINWCDDATGDGMQNVVARFRSLVNETQGNEYLPEIQDHFRENSPHSIGECGATPTLLLYIGISAAVFLVLGFAFLRLQKYRSKQAAEAEDTKAAGLLGDNKGDGAAVIDVCRAAVTPTTRTSVATSSGRGGYGSLHNTVTPLNRRQGEATEMTPVADQKSAPSSGARFQ